MSQSQSEKILFVDDEPHLLDGIRRILRNGFELDTATSGKAGLIKLKESGPYAVSTLR